MTGGSRSDKRPLGWVCCAAEFATRKVQKKDGMALRAVPQYPWESFLGIDGIDGFSCKELPGEEFALTAGTKVASKVSQSLSQTSFECVLKADDSSLFVLSSWRYMAEEDFCALSIALQPDADALTKSGRRSTTYKSPMGLYAFTPVVLDCKSTVTCPLFARGKMVDRKCQNPECIARIKRGEKGLCPRSIWKQEFGRDWPPAHASGVLNAYHGWGKQSDKMLELISFVPMVHGTNDDGKDEEERLVVAYSRTEIAKEILAKRTRHHLHSCHANDSDPPHF